MLVELSNAVGNYLHDVFVMRLDWWVLLGFVAAAMKLYRKYPGSRSQAASGSH